MSIFRVLLRSWFLHPLSEIIFLATGIALALIVSVSIQLYKDSQDTQARIFDTKIAVFYLHPTLPKGSEDQVLTQVKAILAEETNESPLTSPSSPHKPQSMGFVQLELVETETFIKYLREKYPRIAEELLQIDSEVERLIPRYISYAGPLPSGKLESIKKLPGVERVDFQEKKTALWLRHVEKISTFTYWGSWIAFGCVSIWVLLLAINQRRVHLSTQKHLKRLGAHPLIQLAPVAINVLILVSTVSVISIMAGPKIESRATRYLLSDLAVNSTTDLNHSE